MVAELAILRSKKFRTLLPKALKSRLSTSESTLRCVLTFATNIESASNGSGFNAIDVGDFNAALIQAADGEFVRMRDVSTLILGLSSFYAIHQLVQQFTAGTPVTITFPQTGGLFNFPDAAGGLISSFTRSCP